MKHTAIALILSLATAGAAQAQPSRKVEQNYQSTASAVVASYRNALAAAKPQASSAQLDEPASISPYIYQLTSPGVYYSSAVAEQFTLDAPAAQTGWASAEYREALLGKVNALLTETYTYSPQLIHYSDQQVEAEQVVDAAVVAQAKTEDLNPIIENATQISDVADVMKDVDVDLKVEKPNFWTKSGNFSLQFTQNYFSENWYKGGNNNLTMLSNLVLEANYNDQKKIQWDNKLDLRLGFVTATSDSCHQFLTSNDKIALYSKLGVKAAKFWNYTLSVDANTQFMPGYKSNDRRKYSDFISPLDAFVSLGMDFKPQLKNKSTLSVALLPLSYKMRYIGADDETIHKAYNMADRSFKQDFGSKVEFNTKFNLLKDLSWRCRFYYFTSYEYAESEMENALSFQFNKYISTEVYTLWRFDDNRAPQFRDDNLGYFQFKEYFTLGLSYKF